MNKSHKERLVIKLATSWIIWNDIERARFSFVCCLARVLFQVQSLPHQPVAPNWTSESVPASSSSSSNNKSCSHNALNQQARSVSNKSELQVYLLLSRLVWPGKQASKLPLLSTTWEIEWAARNMLSVTFLYLNSCKQANEMVLSSSSSSAWPRSLCRLAESN